ncbi:MAG: HD-GYP domain-containing protein, partial [Thermodesulfobacteriota bacterium]|nr:HD-GYP domain-containing protein [Thermodesulfobacteriota bacterium]
NKRDSKECYTPHEALKHMYAKMRNKLDAKLLAVFIRNMSVYPAGTVVEMSNGAVGIVVTVNPKNSTRPTVLIYHPEIPKNEALMVDLAVEDRLKIVNTIRPENLSREVFSYLSPSRQINYYVDVS